MVAPYFGADPSDSRAGWDTDFVQRIRRGMYTQIRWDMLPLPGSAKLGSILRLDHIQPIGLNEICFERTGFRLTDEATQILDQWLQWVFLGTYPAERHLDLFRSTFGEEGCSCV